MKPAVRISLGVVALTVGLLIVADSVLEIFPDPDAPLLEVRTQLCESLAVQYSSLVQAGDFASMARAMEGTVALAPEVLSIGLRSVEGDLLAMSAEHVRLWRPESELTSTPTHARVPIFEGEQRWGTLEVGFTPLHGGGVRALLANPLHRLIGVLAAAGFLVYLVYLSRTLRYLDPSKVVPGRVRAALDQLVEGALILDQDQRIVLVNSAFAEKVGRTADSLLGVDPSTLGWVRGGEATDAADLPWVSASRDGARRTDLRLELDSPTQGVRVLTGNVAASTSPPAVDTPGPAPATGLCKTLGPLSSDAEAQAVSAVLGRGGTRFARRLAEPADPQTWVVLSRTDQAATEQMRTRLERAGLSDFRFLARGTWKGRVSYGTYRVRRWAEHRVAALEALGLDVELRPQLDGRAPIWLDLPGQPFDRALAAVTALLDENPSLTVASIPCTRLASR